MIPFSPPRIRPEVIKEIEDTLNSGWITTGPKAKQFEKDLTAYCGHKITNALNSATASMEMAMRYLGIGPGDEVIIPSYTYCATANVVVHVGATPVLVDVSPNDFNLDPIKVEAAITPKTKAIIPVDIGGWPCDYDALYRVIDRQKHQFVPTNPKLAQMGRIVLLADSAHAFGALYRGKRCGSLADITIFSFHAVKNLTTAEGGAICWNLPDGFNHEEIYKKINTMSLHGQSKDAFAKAQAGAWRYDVDTPGYKCNLTDIHACLGLVELRYYQENLDKRRTIFEAYNDALKGYDWAILPQLENSTKTSSFHLYNLRIKGASEDQRDKIVQKIAQKEVIVNVHFIPIPMLSAYKKDYQISDYPNCYNCFAHEISLPVYFDLTDDEVQTVISAVIESVKEVLNA